VAQDAHVSVATVRRTVRRMAQVHAAFPSGVASVRQLAALGFSERTVYKRCLDGGPWQRILPGIVLLFTGRPTRDQEVQAALLLCGDGAVVTGMEACRRYDLRRGPKVDKLDRSVTVLIPHERQRRSVGFVEVERTHRMPETAMRGGVPLAPLPRACMDAARRLRSAADVTELLAEPVQRRLCTVSALVSELEAASRRGTARPRAVLNSISAGVRSAAERSANELWRASGLPAPSWNCKVHTPDGRLLGIADCWVDDVAMVWEIESTEWHLSPADHDRTVDRAAAFTAAGAVYVASKPSRITREPAAVVSMLRAAYEQARARPRPPLIGTPLPPL
jgi:hypothetical protein